MCCYNSVDRLSAAGAMSLVVARHGLVAFCDDDNWLAKDFVQVAFDTMRTQPRAAEIGSQGTAEIAGDAPPWFARYAHDHALGSQGDALSSSEDREPHALRLLGHEVHCVEGLRFRHEISARCLQRSRFLTMVEMAHRTVPIIAAYLGALRGDPPLERATARRLWLRRCGAIAAHVVRKPLVLVAGVRRRRVSTGAVQRRRLRGAWTGWRLVGPRYAEVQDAVFAPQTDPSPDGGGHARHAHS